MNRIGRPCVFHLRHSAIRASAGGAAAARSCGPCRNKGSQRQNISSSTPIIQRRCLISSAASTVAEPTIYALSTAPGRAAIAVIRTSGPAAQKASGAIKSRLGIVADCALQIYHALCPGKVLPQPRHAVVRSLFHPAGSTHGGHGLLDSTALVLHFPAPNSVSGEDVLEFHVHGGPAIVKAVLTAIGECSSPSHPVRYAEPGEFTRRAFLNDRMDLPQIEALGDTLSAVTEEQRRISVQGTVSGLSARYEGWRLLLLYARGELEALIDFSEDQHFDESPDQLAASVAVQVDSLERRLSIHRDNAIRGELLRNGISISLIGAPNVGKSSLLNLIVGRNAAIVSKEAGTTRDIIEVGIDLGGFFCRLGDTAGLRQSPTDEVAQVLANVVGEIEKEGIRRAKERAMQSDVVLLVLSIEPSIQGQGAALSLEPEVLETGEKLLRDGKNVVVVVNKMDHYSESEAGMVGHVTRAVCTVLPGLTPSNVFCLSCRDAEKATQTDVADLGSLQAFLTGLTKVFKNITSPIVPDIKSLDAGFEPDPSQWQESLGATQRQGSLLEECRLHLVEFLNHVRTAQHPKAAKQDGIMTIDDESADQGVDIVMAAESLRVAATCLGKITGRGEAGDVEEVLGVVFEK